MPTYQALIKLGGSGTNNEICEQVIKDLQLSDEVVDESHLGSESQTELEYQLAWARTYLKNFGVIINSARSVWSITPDYTTGVERGCQRNCFIYLQIEMLRDEKEEGKSKK